MAIKETIVNMLQESRLQRIDFLIDGSAVTRARFQDIAQHITAGDIGVGVDNTLPADADASYNPEANTIGYPASLTQSAITNSPQKRSLILHECTHAVVDDNRERIRVLADEAAGYLVQIMYRLLCGQKHIIKWAEDNKATQDGKVWYETLKVIDAKSMFTRCVILNSMRDCFDLMQALKAHRLYNQHSLEDRTRADGV